MGFDTFLQRHFAGFVLIPLIAAAYWQASGITTLVGSALAPGPKSLADSQRPVDRASVAWPPAAEDHATSARVILERNPFDSVTPRPLDAPRSKIQKVSAREFNVDRAVVDEVLENRAGLMKGVRIFAEQLNGRVVGIRLLGIRPDTLLGTLGFENGDLLETINGFDMTSPEKTLEAYPHLRMADHLVVQVNRRGQSTTIDFNIK
jgi:general secretion pathway protein C